MLSILCHHVQLFATPWTIAHQSSQTSPSPEVYPSSCSLHQWCHPASHPLMPSSSCALNFPQHQGLFQGVSCSHQMTQTPCLCGWHRRCTVMLLRVSRIPPTSIVWLPASTNRGSADTHCISTHLDWERWPGIVVVLPSPSSLCSPHIRQVSQEIRYWGKV